MPASRRLQQWISASAGPQLLISEGDPRNLDATATATQQLACGLVAWWEAQQLLQANTTASTVSLAWLERWLAADQALQSQLDRELQLQLLRTSPRQNPQPLVATGSALDVGE